MKSINKPITKFFSERLQFLRPISPMVLLTSNMNGGEPSPTTKAYHMFSEVENRCFNIKNTVTDNVNLNRADGTNTIEDNIIPRSLFSRFTPVMPI